MKRGAVKTREQKAAYNRIWQSFNGCNCPPEAKPRERCTLQWIRCDGRMKVVDERLRSQLGVSLAGEPIDAPAPSPAAADPDGTGKEGT